MRDERIDAHSAAEPVGPYPHGRIYGDLFFLSGVGPREPGAKEIPGVTLDAEGNITAYDIEVQTRAVVKNIEAILEAAGGTLEDVLDIQVFLTNMKADFKKFNQVYGEYFKEIGPTRTTIEVGALPTPIAVEFKVIARSPKRAQDH